MVANRERALNLKWIAWVVGLACCVVAVPGEAQVAEQPPAVSAEGAAASADAAPAESDAPESFWEILLASGWVGLLIVLLSIAAVALVVEYSLTIRRVVLMPPGLADQVNDLLAQGKTLQAMERCGMEPSFLAAVVAAGLNEADNGWPAVEKATEESLAEHAARLFRKIEYLSVIASIGPMLGLLGTVIGLIYAFREVAMTQGAARAADLAQGIYLALVTTVEGLVVAIPSLGALALFRNRADELVAQVAESAQRALAPLKRQRVIRAKEPTPPPVAGGR